jgi:hypothetical protein
MNGEGNNLKQTRLKSRLLEATTCVRDEAKVQCSMKQKIKLT